ncbi:hypothetical protein D3C72_1827890 [compost metagenome]
MFDPLNSEMGTSPMETEPTEMVHGVLVILPCMFKVAVWPYAAQAAARRTVATATFPVLRFISSSGAPALLPFAASGNRREGGRRSGAWRRSVLLRFTAGLGACLARLPQAGGQFTSR